MTLEETVKPLVHGTFQLVDTFELPTGFRRAIDRGGLAVLAKGHADITVHPLDESDPAHVFIPYSAMLPFAEVRVRVVGKAMQAFVMGKKHVTIDVPSFLDAVLAKPMEELEKNPRAADALKKAFKWRVLRDIFAIMQRGTYTIKDIRRSYPFGFSIPMLERLHKLMVMLVQASTMQMRLIVSAAFVVLACSVATAIIFSGVRGMLAGAVGKTSALFFDGAVCGGIIFASMQLMQFTNAFILKKKLGEKYVTQKHLSSKSLLDFAGGAVAVIVYLVLIAAFKSAPNWFVF
jgi:hypothetical protein